jgi:hypothetical protein
MPCCASAQSSPLHEAAQRPPPDPTSTCPNLEGKIVMT